MELFGDGIGEEFRPQHRTSRGLTTEDDAFELYEQGTKLEAKGDSSGALEIYEKVVVRFPGTDAARDAAKSIESLRGRTT